MIASVICDICYYPQVTALHKCLDMILISSVLPIAGSSF